MTSKTLTGLYGTTYYLNAPVTNLTVAASGYLGGGLTALGTGTYGVVNQGAIVGYTTAVSLAGAGSLTNGGTILATSTVSGAGVLFAAGGSVANGGPTATTALIAGFNGIEFDASVGAVTNGGTVRAANYGVDLVAGGAVTNGAVGDTSAAIVAKDGIVAGAAATVHNYATLVSLGGSAVYLKDGGVVTNGSVGDTTAIIVAGGVGVAVLGASGTVTNNGVIRVIGGSSAAIALEMGGQVINGSATNTTATVTGTTGIAILGEAGAVTNYGTINGAIGSLGSAAGVVLAAGGTITNGTATDTSALIDGGNGAEVVKGTIRNFGTIGEATAAYAAVAVGGTIVNGSTADTTALLDGDVGAAIAQYAGVVLNFGTIRSGALAVGASKNSAIYLTYGGIATNGATTDTAARLLGEIGVAVAKHAGTVSNFGDIGDAGTVYGVYLGNGGVFTNGGSADTSATVTGNTGVRVSNAAGMVRNFGTIAGGSAGLTINVPPAGVVLGQGGSVTNGAAADAKATIGGVDGVYASTVVATVTNFGSIAGDNVGVALTAGGAVVNEAGATIKGRNDGILIGASGTVSNLGTIRGAAGGGVGVYLETGGVLTNGSATNHAALIYGHYGVVAAAPAKITNNGTISGNTGAFGLAVNMAAGSVLTNNAGALIAGYSAVAVLATSTVNNFGRLQALGGDAVVLTGPTSRLNAEAGSVVDGLIFASTGLVDVVSGVASGSAIQSSGKIEGAGTLSLAGGASLLDAGASLLVAEIKLSGSTTSLAVAAKLADSRIWDQTAGTLFIDSGDQLTLTGSANSLTGTVTGLGTLFLDGGADALTDLTLSAGKMTVTNAAVTLAGTIDLVGTLAVTSPNLIVSNAGATLSGGGTIALSNAATNSLHGASAAATLTNGDIIKGAGKLGGGTMTLINTAAGTIENGGSVALTLDTGTNTIANAGLIEALGGGGMAIKSAVANTGTLTCDGTMTFSGSVTGSGIVKVIGGVADFTSALTENVAFGSSGRLVLGHGQAYGGTISGFSHTGTNSLDLGDIAFSGATKATYSGTAASGILTVTDGTHTANIHLTGNYLAATWTLSAAAGGGTHVIDPTAPQPKIAPLVAAMAGFGAGRVAATALSSQAWMAAPPVLVSAHPG